MTEKCAHRGRYAPSPTGRLHLGNARSALLAWLATRHVGGVFVMRIEDVDHQRSRPEFERRMLADLRWLGLDWDEGPDVGGAYGPYRQSERESHYVAAIEHLEVFSCSCSRRELRQAVAVEGGEEPIYPGTCRTEPRHPDRPLALRWCTPPGVVEVADALAGRLRQDVRVEVGDFLLRRRDGAWAYQLAVVVDDAAMAITDVVRGADLLGSTPRQVLLHRALGALGAVVPRYAHVPLILGQDGVKLSKRHGAPDLSALREGGVSPERVIAALARSVGLVGPEIRAIAASELISSFDLQVIRDSPSESALAVDWRELGRA